jgi:hypothetical protein
MVARWAALPGAVVRPTSGPRLARIAPGVDLEALSCRVRPAARGRRPVTQVIGWLPRYATAFAAAVLPGGRLDPEPPRGALPAEAGPLLPQLVGCTLRSTPGSFEITFDVLTAEPGPVTAAAKLCAALATFAEQRR